MPADDPGACNLRFEIPMLGKADSLNAAVATAVAADEALAQKCWPRSVGPEALAQKVERAVRRGRIGQTASARMRRRDRRFPPTMPDPRIVNAQVAGSGTAAGLS